VAVASAGPYASLHLAPRRQWGVSKLNLIQKIFCSDATSGYQSTAAAAVVTVAVVTVMICSKWSVEEDHCLKEVVNT